MTDPLLSVDTASDESTAWVALSRGDLYARWAGIFTVHRLSGGLARRDHLFSAVRQVRYRAITVSAHGAPGVVLDGSGQALFGEGDSREDLALLAAGREVYLCACRSLEGELGERLIDAGATLVVGFTEDPAWEHDEGRRAFARVDRALLTALAEGAGAGGMEAARAALLDEIAAAQQGAEGDGGDGQRDLARLGRVLETMVILPAEEER